MEHKKSSESELELNIYTISNKLRFNIIILSLIVLIIAAMTKFPIASIASQQADQLLRANRLCPINYDKIDLGLFMPSLSLSNAKIPRRCLNQHGLPIELKNINFKFTIPSFVPPGFKFHGKVQAKDTEINIYPRITLDKTDIRIHKTNMAGPFISSFTSFPNLLKGKFNLEGLLTLKKNNLDSGVIKLISNDLVIPAQQISLLMLPTMELNTFRLISKIIKQKILINELIIGEKDKTLHADIKGNIILNKKTPALSVLNLEGKIKFSKEFLSEFSIIEGLMAKAKKVDGYYQFKLGGTFSSPKPSF